MCKLGVRLFLINLILFSLSLLHAEAQFGSGIPPPEAQQPEEDYSESALRRFEIITLSSLPFTAIHSYVVMRGVRMVQENKFDPELTTGDYRIIGIGAVSFSLFIGLWDWWHTRHVDRSAPLVPEPRTPPSPEDEGPVEGTLARLSETHPYTARYANKSLQDSMNKGLNRWANEQSLGFAMPLIQIRF